MSPVYSSTTPKEEDRSVSSHSTRKLNEKRPPREKIGRKNWTQCDRKKRMVDRGIRELGG